MDGCEGGGGAAAWEGGSVVAVLAFVGGDDDGGVFGGALDSLLYRAFAVCAPVVAPAKEFWTTIVRQSQAKMKHFWFLFFKKKLEK